MIMLFVTIPLEAMIAIVYLGMREMASTAPVCASINVYCLSPIIT